MLARKVREVEEAALSSPPVAGPRLLLFSGVSSHLLLQLPLLLLVLEGAWVPGPGGMGRGGGQGCECGGSELGEGASIGLARRRAAPLVSTPHALFVEERHGRLVAAHGGEVGGGEFNDRSCSFAQ